MPATLATKPSRTKGPPPRKTSPASSGVPDGVPSRVLLLGVVGGLIAIACSGVLAWAHWSRTAAPGCGPGSGCERAAASAFGSIPGLGWPLSVVGLAYFVGLLTAYLVGRGRLASWVAWAARVGALGSLFYLGVMVASGYLCQYCIGAHVGNFMIVGAAEWASRRLGSCKPGWQPAAAMAAWVLAATGVGLVEASTREAARVQAEAKLKETTRELASRQQSPRAQDQPTSESLGRDDGPVAGGFEGRFRHGPAAAPVRIVAFTDYQCPDCKRVEGEIGALMKTMGDDLAVSIKHFPLSTVCNPHINQDMHPDACWAARAAEASGQFGGRDAFWKMHEWLFGKNGSFTEGTLREFVTKQLGFDAQAFVEMMEGPAVAGALKRDMDEAMELGIKETPMVFINGVHLKGWNAEQAVTRAVRAVMASKPPRETSEADRPARGPEKAVQDWRESPEMPIPPDFLRRTLGPEDSLVTVVLIGDYLEKNCAEADGLIRLFTRGPGDAVRYVFLHYPVDQSCNPSSPVTQRPQSCLASRVVESAAFVGGTQAFWAVHEWMMTNRVRFQEMASEQKEPPLAMIAAEVRAGPDGSGMGPTLDVAMWKETLENPMVAEIVGGDGARAKALGIRAIPMILVNGRVVERWKVEKENVLPRIFGEARKAGKP